MTNKFLLNDAEHWRTRAEEARLVAKEMKASETKNALLRIGDNYEHLAQWVEESIKELRDWSPRRGIHEHRDGSTDRDRDVRVRFCVGPVEYAAKPLSTPTGGKIVPCSLKKWSQHARSRNPHRLLARADEVIE
jgi:hypothetical protein